MWAVAAALTLALFSLPPQIHPDTATYLDHSPVRPPLYPYLLDAFRALFGDGRALAWVARFQVLAISAGALLLATRLAGLLALPRLAAPALYLLLVLPGLKFATAILSEPLCYALLLAFWAVLARDTLRPQPGLAWVLPALAAAVLLLRPQFLFLPVFLALHYCARLAGEARKQAATGLLLLALCLAASFGLRAFEHAQRHGGASAPSGGAEHLLSALLYVAEPGDAAAFSDETRRGLFLAMRQKAGERGLTREHWAMHRDHFEVSLPELVSLVQADLAAGTDGTAGQEGAKLSRGLAGGMAATLLAHMPGRYLLLLARKFYDGQPFYYALVALAGALAWAHLLRGGARRWQLLALAALHSWLSYGVVLATGAYGLRYLMPAEMVLLAVALALGLHCVWPKEA